MLSLLNKDKSLVFNQIKSFRNFKNTHTFTPNSPSGTRYHPGARVPAGVLRVRKGVRGSGYQGVQWAPGVRVPKGREREGDQDTNHFYFIDST